MIAILKSKQFRSATGEGREQSLKYSLQDHPSAPSQTPSSQKGIVLQCTPDGKYSKAKLTPMALPGP